MLLHTADNLNVNREAARNPRDCIFECRVWCCPVRHLPLSRCFRQCNSGFAANSVCVCSFSGTFSFSASVQLSHVHWCRWMLHPHPFFLRPRVFRCASFAAGYRPRVNSQRPIQSSSNIQLLVPGPSPNRQRTQYAVDMLHPTAFLS